MQRSVWYLLLLLLLAGCSSKPYTLPNHREEGPSGGLLSGPDGEWSIRIVKPAGKPDR